MSEQPAEQPPLDHAEFERWERTTASLQRAARREADAGAHHISCMLAEQAAQCALKGLLHGMGASREAYGHGLVRLAERAADQVEVDVDPQLRSALQRLTQAYLSTRYPDALPEGAPPDSYGPEHSKEALADMRRAIEFAATLWQGVLEAHQQQADTGGDQG